MSLMRMNYRSQQLGKFVDISVVFPTDRLTVPEKMLGTSTRHVAVDSVRNYEYVPGMKFQTIYLIHGGGDDDTLVYRYSNAERYAQDNNLAEEWSLKPSGTVTLIRLAVVFHGERLLLAEEI